MDLALSRLARIRLGIALVGVAVWVGGVRFDEPRTRVVGMVILALALLLRFLPRRLHGASNDQEHSD